MKKQTNTGPPVLSKSIKRKYIATLSSIVLTCGLSACTPTKNVAPVCRQSIYFDTAINITLYDYPGNSGPILDECMELCSKYENLFSATVEGSDIWNINHSCGQAVTIDNETAKLLDEAYYYCELSEGLVDITMGGLSNLWDFSHNANVDTPVPPDNKEIANALSHVNYKNVQLITLADGTSQVILNDPNLTVELGFIAKGYIADRLGDMLLDKGVTSAIINLGGNVKCIGTKASNTPFEIGIQEPFAPQGEYIDLISCDNTSLVSSGVYERYYYYNDSLYHHILDVNTGYPIESNILGVTIKTESATAADALSTLCFILGIDDGLKLIESLPDTEAMYITDNYEVIFSSGMNK